MLVEQVDSLDSQTPPRRVGDLLDVVGATGQSGLIAVLVEGKTEFGGDHHFDVNTVQRLGRCRHIPGRQRPDADGQSRCVDARRARRRDGGANRGRVARPRRPTRSRSAPLTRGQDATETRRDDDDGDDKPGTRRNGSETPGQHDRAGKQAGTKTDTGALARRQSCRQPSGPEHAAWHPIMNSRCRQEVKSGGRGREGRKKRRVHQRQDQHRKHNGAPTRMLHIPWPPVIVTDWPS